MGHIKFKLEDGNVLVCDYIDDTNFVEFLYEGKDQATVNFKMHRIQFRALIKALNVPLKLEVELKK